MLSARNGGALVLRLIVGLSLLCSARVGVAQGTWSVISFPVKPGEVRSPIAVAVDAAGSLYVADMDDRYVADGSGYKIQKRDAQGAWSVIAMHFPVGRLDALSVDTAGNLLAAGSSLDTSHYCNIVCDGYSDYIWWIQTTDSQGHEAVLANGFSFPRSTNRRSVAIAVDTAGNLHVAIPYPGSPPGGAIGTRDDQGNWFVIANSGGALGEVGYVPGLAVHDAGNLYVAERWRIQKRDPQGNWSVIDGPYGGLKALAVDGAGHLYVADSDDGGRIRKRDVQGNWAVIATEGAGPGQVSGPSGLAVDAAGNLYVADTGNNRVLKYTPQP